VGRHFNIWLDDHKIMEHGNFVFNGA